MYDLVCGGVVIDPGESLYQPGPGCQLSPYILDLKISLDSIHRLSEILVFLKWQPGHFPVTVFGLFRLFHLGFSQGSLNNHH